MVEAGVPAPPGRTRARPFAGLRRLSDRTPLRTKLISAVLVLVIMALVAISIASVYMLRDYVTTQHDSDLQANFGAIGWQRAQVGSAYPRSGMVAGVQQPGVQLTWTQNPLPPFGVPPSGPLPALPTSSNWASGASPVLITVPSQSGPDTWRVIGDTQTLPVVSGDGSQQTERVTLVLAIDLGNVNAMTHRLALFDLIVGGAIVIVLAAVGAAVIQANLRPLNDIELTAGQIARGHLNHRIPERDPRTEIGSLGRSLNTMLSQIENAFNAQEESEQAAHQSEERMRRFIADASHELRTPLTTIRGFAEYYRQRGGARQDQDLSSRTDGGSAALANGHSAEEGLSSEDLDRIMKRLEAEASRMGLLVEDLLQLARLDQQRPLDLAPVDLLMLAADAVQDARMVAPDRQIDLTVAPGAAFIVDGDEQRLRQVIANLVNNALTHTPSGTPVRVRIASGTLTPPAGPGAGRGSAGSAGGAPEARRPAGRPVPAVVLDVEDDGPGMTAEQAQRVFERFYRADQARNRASGGTGLGLAIVAGLVAAHGGTVSVTTAPGEGADFQVKLPLSPDASAAHDEGEGEDSDLDGEELDV
jgi:two-component system, OmpR family, sensor kinase